MPKAETNEVKLTSYDRPRNLRLPTDVVKRMQLTTTVAAHKSSHHQQCTDKNAIAESDFMSK